LGLKDSPPQAAGNAFAVPFNDGQMAVQLAAMIAQNTAMPPFEQFDEFCRDVLLASMNTV
jgi:hypothetical protein